jgi:exopolysaccharide biosynthesis protein
MRAPRRLFALAGIFVVLASCRPAPPVPLLGQPEPVAAGVVLYRTTDTSLVAGAGPIAAYLLRVDPAQVTLQSALSNDEVASAEPVESIARRHGAVAAVNGGYFNRVNGEPLGLLKVSGELVSDASLLRGAVIIERRPDGTFSLSFDQLSAKMTVSFHAAGRDWTLPIDGVDTTRARGRLMLYTPAYHADTDTAPTGTEWLLDGHPLRVVDVRANFGHTKIPRHGAVLSYGGIDLPEPLATLKEDVEVHFDTRWKSTRGVAPDRLDRAESIVNGAGLLRQGGTTITDWQAEGLNRETFTDVRNPRTVIGADQGGIVWLIVVDGRQPDYSIGMAFADLERLCDRLGLTDALNLDGGGSTTMVVNGRLVNHPSDPSGPRPVSDAIVVIPNGPASR